MRKVVIVGGVAGGASCATRLRRLDEDAQIILLERGEYVSYANCGLPYYVGDVIQLRGSLMVQTPEALRAKYAIDVRVLNEVVSIDREAKTVSVRWVATGETYEESYDTLVLATGSSPVVPPLPGADSPFVRTLWSIPDSDDLRAIALGEGQEAARSAVVVGGGFIGLEMAENLRALGLDVSLVEMSDQVMPPLDYEMAQLVHESLVDNGIGLHLGDGVESFENLWRGTSGNVRVHLTSGVSIDADVVILSVGVRPNSQLAADAGLELGERGGIVVDDHMRTSDKSIYAVGDVVQVTDFVFDEPTMVPLAGPANKQGRIVANNICGADDAYKGTQGTSIAKVFDRMAASTGANEKTLQRHGLERGKDYDFVILAQDSHAKYYPGAAPMVIKLLFSMDGDKIFGAQIVGHEGVDKRIDTIATTLRLGGGVDDLAELELAYAPPFSSAKDPVNMAGFVARNQIDGLVRIADWDVYDLHPDVQLLDVREMSETIALMIPGAIHISLGEVRDNIDQLDPERPVVVMCAGGVRAYNAARMLMQRGFVDVQVYPGGSMFYVSTHYDAPETFEPIPVGATSQLPVREIRQRIETMNKERAEQESQLDDTAPEVEPAAEDDGYIADETTVLSAARVPLASQHVQAPEPEPEPEEEMPREKTLVVCSGDIEKIMASFLMAESVSGAGTPVTMFFTLWGLEVLRKPQVGAAAKTAVEKTIGMRLPRGFERRGLARSGTGDFSMKMMKRTLNGQNALSLPDLIVHAMGEGIRIVACTTSMELMGLAQEDLIEGVELGDMGTYLSDENGNGSSMLM